MWTFFKSWTESKKLEGPCVFTSFPQRGGPGWSAVGAGDFADVDEVGSSVQQFEATVDHVQPLFVDVHACHRP